MAARRIQNRIAESRFLLPAAAVIATGTYLAAGLIEKQMWIQFAFFALSTWLFAETNNINALLRIYSRMVSSSFLMLSCVASFLFADLQVGITQLCIITFYYTIFKSYMLRDSARILFFAFLAIGIVSTFFVQILFYVPFLWLLTATNLRTLRVKSFLASFLALITPYWFYGTYLLLQHQSDILFSHFSGLIHFQPIQIPPSLTQHQLITLTFIILLAIIGIIHFLRHSYLDKIRTRMLYEIFITIDILSIIYILLQPQHYNILLTLIIINTSPLIAHFITVTRTRFTNIAFLIILTLTFALIAYNLWMPSFNF